jgi:hypothetical protein
MTQEQADKYAALREFRQASKSERQYFDPRDLYTFCRGGWRYGLYVKDDTAQRWEMGVDS